MRALFAFAVLLVGAAGVACRSESRDAARREAARLSHAINVVIQAPNDAKREPLTALEKVPCTAEDLCELKSVCAAAYKLHVRGLERIADARSALSAQGESEAAVKAGDTLAAAEKDLAEAKKLAERCTALGTRAATAYGL